MISSTSLDRTTVHITVTGRLAVENTQELRQALVDAGEQGASYILMSMDQLEFMDSSALSALVSGLKTARKAGGELFLIAPSAAVNDLLELTLLNQVIPSCPRSRPPASAVPEASASRLADWNRTRLNGKADGAATPLTAACLLGVL